MTASRSTSNADADDLVTGNFGVACYLWFSGFVVNMEWEHDVCFFRFTRSPELQTASSAYHKGRATVDPRKFWPKVAEFKSMVYASKP